MLDTHEPVLLHESPSPVAPHPSASSRFTAVDRDLHGHGHRTGRLAADIGIALGLEAAAIRRLTIAAQLHDIGKALIDQATLLVPRELAPFERIEIERHPQLGFELLAGLVHPDIADAVLAHHERFDGLGYPFGIGGDDIPLLARIIAVADAFDAIVSERVYKQAWSHDYAVAELVANAGSQFDPDVVEAALTVLPAPSVPAAAA